MRRVRVGLLAVGLLASLLAGCSGGTTTGDPEPTADGDRTASSTATAQTPTADGDRTASGSTSEPETPAAPDLGAYPNPEEAICLPDGSRPVEDWRGPVYACAATAYQAGRTVSVAYLTTTPLTNEPANTWFNMLTSKPLDAEQLKYFGLAEGDDSIDPAKGPVCLYDGNVYCVGPDYPNGFGYYMVYDAQDMILGKGDLYYDAPGLPDQVAVSEIEDLLQGYTVYTLYSSALETEGHPFAG
ncbi:MAG: hypothetical protein LBR27_02190 [Bifidobacteriaceae bacterium]|jgi:hypothetical protein|nr:hypothetical protein [Bifidobacteriaceae bacterium]